MKHVLNFMLLILLPLSLLPINTQSLPDTGTPPGDTPDQAPIFTLENSSRTNSISAGHSPNPARPKTDEYFITDVGSYMDQYLFRADVPNGRLPIEIEIDRYYSDLITSDSVNSAGFLTNEARNELVNKKLIPSRATLYLEVYDVDHNASGCAEVDHVYINNLQLFDFWLHPVSLTSGNNTWSQWSVSFPIQYLKFPISKGTSSNPPEGVHNLIEIDIDVNCLSSWAVEVDWAAIEIPSPVRPILFVHGWTGTANSFSDFYNDALTSGIPALAPQTYGARFIDAISDEALLIIPDMNSLINQYGVDKVNLFAHSKGGLVTRMALRNDSIAEKTDQLITFGSPHHGTTWADPIFEYFIRGLCARNLSTSDPDLIERCFTATQEFSISSMRENFNYQGCHWDWFALPPGWDCEPRYVQQPNVDYYSFIGTLDEAITPEESATFPWEANTEPFPTHINVNEYFPLLTHGSLIQNPGAFRCSIAYLSDDTLAKYLYCPSLIPSRIESTEDQNLVRTEEDVSMQTVLAESATLNAGISSTAYLIISGTGYATFDVFASGSFTVVLISPDGIIIDPDYANASPDIDYYAFFDNEVGYSAKYEIHQPVDGEWQVQITAHEDLDYGLLVQADSNVEFVIIPEEPSYRPGETATITAGLLDSGELQTGVTITGEVSQNGIPTALYFNDEGSNGDFATGDGIYTAQFTAAAYFGYASISGTAIKDSTMRQQSTTLTIGPQTAQVDSILSETPLDNNFNGLYDQLQIEASINVLYSSDFEVSAVLEDIYGETITSAFYSTILEGSGPLSTGFNSIPLRFNGADIYNHGVDGPFNLKSITITDVGGTRYRVDYQTDLYSTDPYSYSSFERILISLESSNELAIDGDSDGKYDQLDIFLDLNIVYPGTYSWNGRLVDFRGNEIGWFVDSGYLSGLSSIQFSFDGHAIGVNGEDGPYSLQDVSIFQTTGGNASTSFKIAHVSLGYTYLDFEGAIPRIKLEEDTFQIDETAINQVLQISLNTAWDTQITVDVATVENIAEADQDYAHYSETLIFEPGEIDKTIPIDIIDDDIDEIDETYSLILSNPSGANLYTPSTTIIEIMDNDGPNLTISEDQYSVEETTPSIKINLDLSTVSIQPVTIQYSTRNGTALDGVDFQGIAGLVEIPAGQQVGEIEIALINDEQPEIDEQFYVDLLLVDNATLVGVGTAVITISSDDDFLQFIPLITH